MTCHPDMLSSNPTYSDMDGVVRTNEINNSSEGSDQQVISSSKPVLSSLTSVELAALSSRNSLAFVM